MATLTTNTNFLSPVEFQLTLKRLPNVEFFIKSANIPGYNSQGTELGTPFKIINEPSDRIIYDDFTVTVLCDENMTAFREVSDWLVALTFPDSFDQYANLGEEPKANGNTRKSDATLIVLNSNKNPNIKVKFEDMFPLSISGIQLDTAESDLTPPTFDITFKYSRYTIEV